MSSRPIHFEVQADDPERAKKFYENVLGWKIDKTTAPGTAMDYWMINTGEGPGINGGMYNRKGAMGELHSFDCTILVDNIDKAIAAIKANGGKLSERDGKEKWEMQGLGWFANAFDTEGNTFGIMQATGWQPK